MKFQVLQLSFMSGYREVIYITWDMEVLLLYHLALPCETGLNSIQLNFKNYLFVIIARFLDG